MLTLAGNQEPTVTAKFVGGLTLQSNEPCTVISPSSPAAPVVTVIELVPAPAVMLHPVGTVHV